MIIKPCRVIVLLLQLLLAVGVCLAGDKIEWKPVSVDELTMDKPVVDPDSDAEAIFWEVRLDDKNRNKLYYEHYVRIKIFTERGREKYSKINIRYLDGTKVENIAARVINSDGTITDVPTSAIFESDLIKARRFKIKSKSFAVPGIEPGVIIEYQYRERFKGDSLEGERLVFQRDIPMQRATYWVRPYKNSFLKPYFFNMPESRFRKDVEDDEFLTTTLKNVPAFKEEPFMAPEDTFMPWALLQYSGWGRGWRSFGIGNGNWFDEFTEPNKEAKKAAQAIVSGASTEEEKVRRIFAHVRSNFRNLSFDKSSPAPDKFKIKKADDLLPLRMGYSSHIDLLFAMLLRGIGMSPELVIASDRSEYFFNPNSSPAHFDFLHLAGVAVEIDGKRRYFNPGTPYLPFGRLVWYEEQTSAMVADSAGYDWVLIEMADEKETIRSRKGKFKLDSNGDLEGTVERSYSGYSGAEMRRAVYFEEHPARIEEIKESISKDFQVAEVSDIEILDFDSPDLALVHRYKIRIPGYAQRTGSRIFFNPGVFQANSKPVFSSEKREHPIYFQYAWTEFDEIEIELPEQFNLESYSAPSSVRETSNISNVNYDLDFDQDTNILTYKRDFYFGTEKRIFFAATAYPALKKLFEKIHSSDTHALGLKLRAE